MQVNKTVVLPNSFIFVYHINLELVNLSLKNVLKNLK